VRITVADAEAFIVTSQSTNATLYTGSSRAITWVKGTTDLAPINCANVNIKLSIDGGLTFPIMLKENTPNDGIEDIIVPNSATTSARILVEAANNIFYNVNASNFTIDATTSTFLVNNTSGEQGVCNFGNESASYNLNLDFVNGFSESVSLTASGQPSGASVVFSPATVNSDENVVMTVTNLDGATAQMYTINVQATSTTLTKSANVNLNLTEQVASLLTLVSPVNGVINTSLTQTLSWNEDSNATSYDIEIASDVNFTNLLYSDNVTVNYYLPANLIEDTLYYWRVVAKNNCSESNYSSTFSFTTITCNTCISFGETSFGTSTTLVQFNTINNISEKPSGYGDYTAINTVVKLNESHDLTVNVNTDGSYRVQVKAWIDWNQNCSFDDDGEEYDLGFAYNTTDDPTDLSPLSITVPSGANIGNTVMRVSSRYTNSTITYPSSCMEGFDGEVEDYTIIVEDVTASIEDFSFNGFNIYPNPTKGTFTLNLEVVNTAKVSVQLYDVRGRLIGEKNYFNTNINFSESVFFEKAGTGLYLVKITNGNKQTTRKILIK
jgi:hypothetical protein